MNDYSTFYFNHINTFFENFTLESIQFLTWTSPIVAALLALTTIVFSQYNERLLNSSNLLNKEIKTSLKKESDNKFIISKLNEMIFILRGKSVFTFNLYFFALISFLSSIAWLLAGIGYLNLNKDLHSIDKIIIIIGLFIITITFMVLPIILISLSKKPVLTLNLRNRLSFKNLSLYFNRISTMPNDILIQNLISPLLNISLGHDNKIKIDFEQEIPVSNTYFIYEFNGLNLEKEYIKVSNSTTEDITTYHLESYSLNENSYESIFRKLNDSSTQQLYVFSDKKHELLATFKLKKITLVEGYKFSLSILTSHRLSINDLIQDLLDTDSGFLYSKRLEKVFYSLKKV